MSDPRLLAANGRVAHLSLRGQVTAERFVAGRWMRVCAPVAALLDRPQVLGGRRQRELVLHERFLVLEEGTGFAFGVAGRDGYAGYLPRRALVDADPRMTHVVCARQSYFAAVPALKHGRGAVEPVSFGVELAVVGHAENGRWAEVTRLLPRGVGKMTGEERKSHIPMAHLRPIEAPEADPVAVALRFLGTPYLWGGNSGFGVDCSGLVQGAHLACAIPCPGDSDMQAAHLGRPLADGARLAAGDLVFWPGHVGIMTDPLTVVHANAYHMAVVVELLTAAVSRIGVPAQVRRR